MSVVQNIVRTYRQPIAVIKRIAIPEAAEARSLAYLMGGCVLAFVSQWPALARQSYLRGDELNLLLSASLMGWLFVMPLVFYVITIVMVFAQRIFGRKVSSSAMRAGVFWSFFAASPLMLLFGLVSGFIGDGIAKQLVGLLWFAAFLIFVFATVRSVRAAGA